MIGEENKSTAAIFMEPNYVNLVIKIIKSYTNWHNCSNYGHNIEHTR